VLAVDKDNLSVTRYNTGLGIFQSIGNTAVQAANGDWLAADATNRSYCYRAGTGWFDISNPAFYHPTADVSYQNVSNVPLFANGVSYWDVKQGAVGDCWLLSALAEVALRNSSVIQSMFTYDGTAQENGQTVSVWTVRFYENGTPQYVTVDSELPAGGNYYDNITHNIPTLNSNGTFQTESELWVALAEKAYAQLDVNKWVGRDGANWYDNPAVTPLGQTTGLNGGWIGNALEVITGQAGSVAQPLNFTNMVNAWNAGDYIGLSSQNFATLLDSNGVVSTHAYAVIGFNSATQQFELFNPWGINNGTTWATQWLSWNQIQQSFSSWDFAL
jgi:hypothetical protein